MSQQSDQATPTSAPTVSPTIGWPLFFAGVPFGGWSTPGLRFAVAQSEIPVDVNRRSEALRFWTEHSALRLVSASLQRATRCWQRVRITELDRKQIAAFAGSYAWLLIGNQGGRPRSRVRRRQILRKHQAFNAARGYDLLSAEAADVTEVAGVYIRLASDKGFDARSNELRV